MCTWVVPDQLDPRDLDALGLGLLWKVQAQCSRGSEDEGGGTSETAITERGWGGEGQGQEQGRGPARERTRARRAAEWTVAAEGRGTESGIESVAGEPGSGGRQALGTSEERQDQPAEREVQEGGEATATAATETTREAIRNLKVRRWWAERQSDTDGCCIS